MGAEQKNGVAIAVQANYLLTPFGSRYCRQRRIPLSEITTSDMRRGTGFVWNQVHVDFLGKLVALGLISEIEIRRQEFSSKRPEIVRLSREIGYALILEELRRALHNRLQALPEVEKLLEHPSIVIAQGNERQLDPEIVKRLVTTESTVIETLRASLLESATASVPKEDFLHNEKVHFMHRAIDSLERESWFYLYVVDHRGGQELIFRSILDVLEEYAKKAVIPEYIGLILTELMNAAEYVHLRDLAERDQYLRTHPHELEQKLRDPEFRRKLTSRGEITKELLSLVYRFETGGHDGPDRRGLDLVLSNSGLLGYRSRNEIINRPQKRIRRERLRELVDQDSEGTLAGSLIGIYLNALEEAASAQGVTVDSDVLRDEREDRTRTTLKIRF